MNEDTARAYLSAKPEAAEDYPFGPDVAVFKVLGKMFATLADDAGTPNMNLKCDPDEAQMLRDVFPSVVPGYHMNKDHWNTIILDGTVPTGEIERMIDNSYSLVVRKMKKADRVFLETRYPEDQLYKTKR